MEVAPAGGGEASEDEDAPANATRMPDVGPAAQQARLKVWDETLAALKKIDPKTLSPDNQVNYAIYHDQVFNLAEECACAATRCRSTPTPRSGPTCPSWPGAR
jgi:uncharacterized protein (DUF885 family)